MATRRRFRPPRLAVRFGFTLIELLVVIGIISVLISILLPALMAARAQARAIQCQSNVRQLVLALNVYSSQNRGYYPPNQGPAPGHFWYDADRVGEILNFGIPGKAVERGVAVCPEDQDGVKRSYNMNVWASCRADSYVINANPKRGILWGRHINQASQMILISEQWETAKSGSFSNAGWVTQEPFGFNGLTAGTRFGGGTGAPASVPVYGRVNCELPYMRHRAWSQAGWGTAPHGRISIGYADGHVELKSDTDLVDSFGKSTLNSLWSTWDYCINN
jgi:prepilin-type N-terminal cleavage/methylation domain-containing protein/prepilin-type processing-associated H-X9-DG protein